MEPSHPLEAGFRIKGQNLSSLLQHSVLYRQFLLRLSQGRKEPLWSGCVMRLKEQSLLFLPSQIYWEWPREWRARQLFSVSGLEEERVIIREGWETHMGMGIFFFHLSPKSSWLFWFTGGGNKTACLKGLWNKHTQARFSPALKAVKVIELNWWHQQGSVPYSDIRVHIQSWHLGIY